MIITTFDDIIKSILYHNFYVTKLMPVESQNVESPGLEDKHMEFQVRFRRFFSARPRAAEYTIGICKEKAKKPKVSK